MDIILELIARAVAGGTLVVVFALVGEVMRPAKFAGLFTVAPAVALASLSVTVLAAGRHEAATAALGMIVGAAAMVVYCAVAAYAVGQVHALAGTALTWGVWLVVALASYAVALR